MRWQASLCTPTLTLACLFLPGGPPAAGQETASETYTVEPSDVVLPEGLAPGEYRRIIQPFENWTLICDENLKALQKVCNITQSIVDHEGRMAFSWSLAATETGKPMMILRIPAAAGQRERVSLLFPGRKTPVAVGLDGCNAAVCVGMVPVGPILREHIPNGTIPQVAYTTADGHTVTLNAPLKGLQEALQAIE